jgi:hypothetical protein
MGLRKMIFFAGMGAALAYYLDPANGVGRRSKLRQTVDETMKTGGRNLCSPRRDTGKPITPQTPASD